MPRRPRIALVDYKVTENSPSGSCHLRILEGLREEFDFTVFATEFDNPDPTRIASHRVPAVRRPQAALYGSFFVSSSAMIRRSQFDLVQAVEGYTARCDLSYVHFCHRSYLRRSRGVDVQPGLKDRVRRLDHVVRAVDERRAMTRPRQLVVPADDLADDLVSLYGVEPQRITTIPNCVDLQRFSRPEAFDRSAFRSAAGIAPDETVVVFVALGHFERKGLSVLLDGLRRAADPRLRLVVVGGTAELIAAYRDRAAAAGVEKHVNFVGIQSDVRPWLWSADAFASLSSYEVFALAPLQAAAAGLPLLVTDAPGVASFLRHGRHGLRVRREADDVARRLVSFRSMSARAREAMGAAAREAVAQFGADRFVEHWRSTYRQLLMPAEEG